MILNKSKGFTLLEIVIAMSLGTVLLGLSAAMLLQVAKSNRLAQEQAYLQQSAWFAKSFIERDLRRAGYYGGLKSADEISGSLSLVEFDGRCEKGNDHFARQLLPKIYGLNNFAKDFHCLEKHMSESDILSVHYLYPVKNISSKAADADRLYLRVGLAEGRIFKARDQHRLVNQLHDSDSATYEVRAFIYYLRDTGRRCDGEIIPGLYREYNNSKGYMAAEEIVSGVEQFQLQYSINGKLFNADEIVTEGDWQAVDAVSIWILMRSECPEKTDAHNKAVEMADFTVPEEQINKPYVRHLYKFDVSLRN